MLALGGATPATDLRTRMVRWRMKLLWGLIIAVGCALLAAGPRELHAAILFSESFNYPNGELQSASRSMWLKFGGDSNGQSIIDQALFIDDDGTNDYCRALGDFPPIRHGEVYAAFDLKVSTIDPPENTSQSTPYFMSFSEEFGGTTPQIVSRLVMNPGTAAGTFRLGIARGGGSTATTTPWGANLSTGVNHRIVVGYNMDTAVSTLWVNPTSTASARVTNATGIGLPIFGLNWLAFRIDGVTARSGDKTVDNLVVATSLADLLPTSSASPPASGDIDGDGDVDGADFVAWQTSYASLEGRTIATGDANGDGHVTGADFAAWQAGFNSAANPGQSAVPEPSAIANTLFAMLLMRATIRRVRR